MFPRLWPQCRRLGHRSPAPAAGQQLPASPHSLTLGPQAGMLRRLQCTAWRSDMSCRLSAPHYTGLHVKRQHGGQGRNHPRVAFWCLESGALSSYPFQLGQPQSNCKAEPNQSQRHQRLVKQSPNSWPNSWLLSIHCTKMVRLSRTVTCWQAASMITYTAAAGPRIPPGACRGCCTSASTWTASTARWQRSWGARPAHQRRRQHLHTRRQRS